VSAAKLLMTMTLAASDFRAKGGLFRLDNPNSGLLDSTRRSLTPRPVFL